MNLAQGSFRQTLVLTITGALLLSGCHHHSSSASTAAAQFTVSVSVAGLAGTGLVLVNNGIDNLAVASSGTSTFSTTVADFATYSVAVLTQPSTPAQVCSVTNGTGAIEGASVVIAVSCGTVGTSIGRLAYVVNGAAGSLSGYTINATTGALTQLTGSPLTVAGSSSLRQPKIDPTGSFLYVVDSGANEIFAYKINQITGGVNPISGSPYPTGKTPVSLVFNYSGAYLYVANTGDNTISAYTVAFATGVLAPISGSPFPLTGANPGPAQIIAAGAYLFAANFNTNAVDVLSIAMATGALKEVGNGSPYATDTGPYSLAIDPSGAVLYTANTGASNAGSISAFTVDLSNGMLTPVTGNPQPIPALNNIAIDAQSKYLFVTESAGLAVYPIVNKATGALSPPVAGSPFPTGTNPYSVTIDIADQFVYVANDGSADISEFTFTPANGVLTPVAGTPVPAGIGPDFIQIQ